MTQRQVGAVAFFKVGWDQLASSAGPPSAITMFFWWAGASKRRWSHPKLKKAMALRQPWKGWSRGGTMTTFGEQLNQTWPGCR